MPNTSHLGHYLYPFILLSTITTYTVNTGLSVDSELLALTIYTLLTGDLVIMSGTHPHTNNTKTISQVEKKNHQSFYLLTKNLANKKKEKKKISFRNRDLCLSNF